MSSAGSVSGGTKDTTPLIRRSGGINSRSSSTSSLPVVEESDAELSARKKSLRIVYLTNFLSAMGFSILLSSMYQYLEDEAGKSAKAFQGYLVGAFSLGQVIGAPFWGGLSIKYNYLTVFILSIFVRMVGNLMYALTHSFNPNVDGQHNASSHNHTDFFGPNDMAGEAHDGWMGGLEGDMTNRQRYKEYWMTGARLLTGFGAGSMAVCNAYVAGATTMEERTAAMAAGAASGGLGFIMGPLIAIAFTSGTFNIPDANVPESQILLNFETAPAYFSTILCVINIGALAVWFREVRINEVTSPRRKSSKASIKLPEDEPVVEVQPFDKFAACILLFMYFASMIAFSTMETVAVPLLMAEYNMNKRKAAQWCSGVIGALGLESVIMFALAKPLGKRYGERRVLVAGMVILGIAQVASMPFVGPPVATRPQQNMTVAAASWSAEPVVSAPDGPTNAFGWNGLYDGLAEGGYGFGNATGNNASNATHNCDMTWCYTLPKIPFGQYFFATVFLQSAFPLANVMLFTLYSKVLGPTSQGLWMGLLNSSGSAARMLGPIAIMQLFVNVGPRWMYGMCAVMLFGSCTVGLCFYSRLQPHIQQRDQPAPVFNPAFKNPNRASSSNITATIPEEGEYKTMEE